ncbi:helix-turn-helix domain-containing protein [Fodinibius sediminis]|uniref:Helix-turn-helix domain-containing protein n=1 Tax=Fodinibius sediminis TaxID=1214077 RepID=A0A521DLE5_9BACT|nr:helix-turn-helix domain-containing protein [Fodinibius sediminis]SMO72448.1 Helix-turn-helix domain-containing protein [Fodinibius sediminis]
MKTIDKGELLSLMYSIDNKLNTLIKENLAQNKTWMRTSEVADYLNMSESQLHVLKSEGTLPFTKLKGIIYFDKEDINEILESNKNWR